MITPTLLLVFWVALLIVLYGKVAEYASRQAHLDNVRIMDDLYIDHTERWKSRATWWVIEFSLAVVTHMWVSALALDPETAEELLHLCVLPLLPSLAAGPALFSLKFRADLNYLRGRLHWYVSPSNYYDRFWLWVCRDNVRRAGRTAEAAEVSVIAISSTASCILLALAYLRHHA